MNKCFEKLLYTHQRKAPELFKFYDDLGKEVNRKIRMRGISKGFVCVQENFNKTILQSQKNIYWASHEKNKHKCKELIEETQRVV